MKNQLMMFDKDEGKIQRLAKESDPLNVIQNAPDFDLAQPSTSDDQFLATEALCNKEELNLNVTNSIFCKYII
jgi:hypothetical protein